MAFARCSFARPSRTRRGLRPERHFVILGAKNKKQQVSRTIPRTLWRAPPQGAQDSATNTRLLQTAQYWRPRYQDQASPRPRSNSINYYGEVQARIESFLITSPIFSQCIPLLTAAPCTERKFCLLSAFHFVYPKF